VVGLESALTPALSRRERGPFGVGGEFGVILKRLSFLVRDAAPSRTALALARRGIAQ